MQLSVDTKELQEKLELVTRVSTKHATLPALQCVLLEVKGDKLFLRGTNLEIGIEAKLSAKTEEDGVAAVPASTLLQTVNLNQKNETSLRYQDNTLLVGSGISKTEIKCLPVEDFPKLPKVTGEGQTLNGNLFSLGIKSAAFAASQSSIKPELGSVYIFQKKEHTLTFVATDSFRLMEKTVPQKGVTLDDSILLPQKNALEIARVCDHQEEDPVCRLSDNQVSLEFPNGVYITSRLVAGSFPDYNQIIPKEYATKSLVLKEDLVQAFKKTNIFLNKFLQVKLEVNKSTVVVSAESGEVGRTTEVVRAETDGDHLVLNFNQRYLSEALSHFVDDSVRLHLAGIGRPLVIKGVSDSSVRYLVMPMNK